MMSTKGSPIRFHTIHIFPHVHTHTHPVCGTAIGVAHRAGQEKSGADGKRHRSVSCNSAQPRFGFERCGGGGGSGAMCNSTPSRMGILITRLVFRRLSFSWKLHKASHSKPCFCRPPAILLPDTNRKLPQVRGCALRASPTFYAWGVCCFDVFPCFDLDTCPSGCAFPFGDPKMVVFPFGFPFGFPFKPQTNRDQRRHTRLFHVANDPELGSFAMRPQSSRTAGFGFSQLGVLKISGTGWLSQIAEHSTASEQVHQGRTSTDSNIANA